MEWLIPFPQEIQKLSASDLIDHCLTRLQSRESRETKKSKNAAKAD